MAERSDRNPTGIEITTYTLHRGGITFTVQLYVMKARIVITVLPRHAAFAKYCRSGSVPVTGDFDALARSLADKSVNALEEEYDLRTQVALAAARAANETTQETAP
jgi:hypothetical protein